MESKKLVTTQEIISNDIQDEQNEEIEQKENLDDEYVNEEEEDNKENDDEEFEISSSSTSTSKKRKKRLVYITFDEKYDYNANYFYQELTKNELKEIKTFIEKFLSEKLTIKKDVINFFKNYPNIIKGNVQKVQQILNKASEKFQNFSSYKVLNDFFLEEYYTPKPSICECHFFPEGSNERKVVNMIRTCKKSLDIAIYTFTLDSLVKAVIEVHKRGIPVRIICDNEMEKHSTSKIKKLAAEGIVIKTDNSRYYMHHKFAIIDNSVVVTGSFNWSSQAVNHNQENILFYENKTIAQQYTDEYNKLWDNFTTVINREEAKKFVEEKERIKREKKLLELKKEMEKLEKSKKKEEEMKQKEEEKQKKQKEKEKLLKQKEEEKQKKQKEKEILLKKKEEEKQMKLEKQKQKEKELQQKKEKQKEKEIEKEKIKNEKLKEKENKKTQGKNSKNLKNEKTDEDPDYKVKKETKSKRGNTKKVDE